MKASMMASLERPSSPGISTPLLRDLADAPKLAILMDLDGTLMPLSPTPPVQVDAELRELLADLRRLPGVQLVILSGRTRSSLASLFPANDVWLVAEHGAWRRGRDGTFRTAIEGNPDALRRCSDAFEQALSRYPGAWVESKSWSVAFHYRLVAPELHDALHSELDMIVLGRLVGAHDYERLNGPATLEVRHRAANKGTAIDWVLEQVGGGTRLLILGDDVTDEDAFRAASSDDVTVHVGGSDTIARHRLADSDAVRTFLGSFIDERTSTAARSPSSTPMPPLFGDGPAPRLVVISNRLPSVAAPVGRKVNVGGLVSGLAPALEERGGVWLGWSGRATKSLAPDASALHVDATRSPIRAALDLSAETMSLFYDGFCNRSLWPLLHGFCSKVRYEDDEWRAYVQVNRSFAEAVRRLAPPDTPVWVHDYHLMLAGRELRALGHVGPIGFFLHIPLPAVELVETMPWCGELLDAMMDFDLVGFHTERYVANYCAAQLQLGGARSVSERPPQLLIPDAPVLLRKGDRSSRTAAFPIGINPEPFVHAQEGTEDDEIANLIRRLGDRRLVLGVDRLDYSKGIPERLTAFKVFLDMFPEWRRKVSFVQVSVPSRESLPDYAEQRKLVEELVGHINGELGEVDWVPVRYLYRSYAQPELARLYRAASVGVVTPLRDGMNLVAKEYVASQLSDDPGVLLLSRFAGAADQLPQAVLTNPLHAAGVARDLDACLRMPLEERRRRHAPLFEAVTTQTAQRWAGRFLEELERYGAERASSAGSQCAAGEARSHERAVV